MRSCASNGGRRRLGATGILSLVVAGCWGGGGPVVRDTARPQADQIMADAPALLPQVPVTSTTATRGQKSDVQPVAGTTANNGQVAVKLRASVNTIPILDDEVREAMAQYVGELIQTPEALRPQKQQQIYERELQRLIERELVLDEALERMKRVGKTDIMTKLQKEAEKEADKQLREIKAKIGAKSDAEFKTMLQTQGLSESGMRRQFERNFMMIEYVRNIVYPTIERIGLQQVARLLRAAPGRVQDGGPRDVAGHLHRREPVPDGGSRSAIRRASASRGRGRAGFRSLGETV